MDLLIDGGGDLVVSNGDLQLSDGLAAIAQDLRVCWLFFKGEWFANVLVGMPWYQKILGTKNPNIPAIRQIMRKAALSRPGIKTIDTLDLTFNVAARSLGVSLKADTVFGPLVYSQEFIVP